jgi:chromosome segregation ATPase
MEVAHKSRRSQQYTVKNSGARAKRLLIERPREPQWTLVDPAEPAEQTRDLYRFEVEAQPGEPAVLNVHEEQVTRQAFAANQRPDAIEVYVRAKEISKEVRAALTELARQQRQIAELVAQRSQLESQLDDINTEQDRIRQNMAQLDRQGELYARYVKKFSEQEDQVEELRGQIETVSASEAAAEDALAQYVADLDVE